MRKRSKYKPRPTYNVLDLFTRAGQEAETTMKLQQHSAMHALTHGSATYQDWYVITLALNLTAVAIEQSGAHDYRPELHAAMDAHAACGARFIKTGKYGYTGAELQAVNDVLAEHQEIMGQYTKVEVKRMMAQVEANERRGNFYTAATRVVREQRA